MQRDPDPEYPQQLAAQLKGWLMGDPTHNPRPAGGGECCPDFSCCTPRLLADVATRKAFCDAYAAGDMAAVNGFLGSFLGALLRNQGIPARIVGIGASDPDHDADARRDHATVEGDPDTDDELPN